MALEGTLRDFSLSDIFQLIGIQKKTGVLTLKYQGDVVTVSFLNGSVVSADSQRKNLEDRLGSVLVRSGRLSERDLQAALKIQRETLQRLGHILVAGKFMKNDDLREALRLQVTQIVYRLFRWRDGDYHFNQEESVQYDREHFTPLSAESILMEGIRMIDEWPIIERKIRSFEMVFHKTRPGIEPSIIARDERKTAPDLAATLSAADRPESPARNEVLRLAQDEAFIYDLIDGQRNVQEIIDLARMGDFETCRIIYDLISRGHIAGVDTARHAAAGASRVAVGPWFERAAYAAIAAGVVVSLATVERSPFSGSPLVLAPAGALEQVDLLVCLSRLERLDEAAEVYYLQKGFFPDDLRDLVKGGLVDESALRDPWGRSFGFISTPEGYRIIAYDAGGAENPERSVTRGRPSPPQQEGRPRGGEAARLNNSGTPKP